MAYFPFEEGKYGASGALVQGEVYIPTVNGAILYFQVANIDDVVETAIELGSQVLFPKTPINDGGFVAEIMDSEGNRITIQSL